MTYFEWLTIIATVMNLVAATSVFFISLLSYRYRRVFETENNELRRRIVQLEKQIGKAVLPIDKG